MQALGRPSGFFRAVLTQHITPRVNISSKPAKHTLTPGEQTVAMLAMFAAVLVPSGWILAHLEDYKKRP